MGTLKSESDWDNTFIAYPNTKKNFFEFLDTFDDVSKKIFEESDTSFDCYNLGFKTTVL